MIYIGVIHSNDWLQHMKNKVIVDAILQLKNRSMGDNILDINGEEFNDITRKQTNGKTHTLLAIGILSKLTDINRRKAIRLSWLQICHNNTEKVICRFFSDSVNNQSKQIYVEEKEKHTDIVHMPIKGEYSFAMRLLWMLIFFTKNYLFDFFLRIDDDYFLCLDRLLKELPYRPKNGLYWGYIHCHPHMVRVDQGFMVLSRDIIIESLGKLNSSLQCHSFGDQAVALWLQESSLKLIYFSDNSRIIQISKEYTQANLCHNYIGLHPTHPGYMQRYWLLSNEYNNMSSTKPFKIPKIKKFENICSLSKKFDYRYFAREYRDKPVPCKYNPKFRHQSQTNIKTS